MACDGSEVAGWLYISAGRHCSRHGIEGHRIRFELGERVVRGPVGEPFPPVPALGEQQMGEAVDRAPLEREVECRCEVQRPSISLHGGLVASTECEPGGVA